MNPQYRNFTASQAARRLGVSAKALRLYEERGLVAPGRSAAGWRLYDATAMADAEQIVFLRGIGLSLAQIARAMAGDRDVLDHLLDEQEQRLRDSAEALSDRLSRIHRLRAQIADGHLPDIADLRFALASGASPKIGFALPFPWDGEWFDLGRHGAITFITGPLGSGKTRFAEALANALPNARFIPLDRKADVRLNERGQTMLDWLIADGAPPSQALHALVSILAEAPHVPLVFDLIEHGLCEATQTALIACLRARRREAPLFLMTRSTAILDLDALQADETVILCPANHSMAFAITPHTGGRGYEATASCLAPPHIRARTAGMVAMQPAA